MTYFLKLHNWVIFHFLLDVYARSFWHLFLYTSPTQRAHGMYRRTCYIGFTVQLNPGHLYHPNHRATQSFCQRGQEGIRNLFHISNSRGYVMYIVDAIKGTVAGDFWSLVFFSWISRILSPESHPKIFSFRGDIHKNIFNLWVTLLGCKNGSWITPFFWLELINQGMYRYH